MVGKPRKRQLVGQAQVPLVPIKPRGREGGRSTIAESDEDIAIGEIGFNQRRQFLQEKLDSQLTEEQRTALQKLRDFQGQLKSASVASRGKELALTESGDETVLFEVRELFSEGEDDGLPRWRSTRLSNQEISKLNRALIEAARISTGRSYSTRKITNLIRAAARRWWEVELRHT